VVTLIIKKLISKEIKVNGTEILLLGITFKENCSNVRNTKIVAVIRAIKDYNVNITIYVPWANSAEVMHEYGLVCCSELVSIYKYDAIVLGVAHATFLDLDIQILKKENAIVYDVKGILESNADAKV
jgi:UDP-N-acetyl-D-galactosamine dehydrogenase